MSVAPPSEVRPSDNKVSGLQYLLNDYEWEFDTVRISGYVH